MGEQRLIVATITTAQIILIAVLLVGLPSAIVATLFGLQFRLERRISALLRARRAKELREVAGELGLRVVEEGFTATGTLTGHRVTIAYRLGGSACSLLTIALSTPSRFDWVALRTPSDPRLCSAAQGAIARTTQMRAVRTMDSVVVYAPSDASAAGWMPDSSHPVSRAILRIGRDVEVVECWNGELKLWVVADTAEWFILKVGRALDFATALPQMDATPYRGAKA